MNTPTAQRLPGPVASYAIHFSAAITRLPAKSAVDGLRAKDTGAVDIELMARQHVEYQKALRQAGATVTELPALPEYPDAHFVEDTALCLPNLAVMMRPRAETRRGKWHLCERCLRRYSKTSQTSLMDTLKLATF